MKTLQLAAVTVVLTMGGTAQANFLNNSTFNTDLTGWTYQAYAGSGGAVWTADNGGIANIRGDWDHPVEQGHLWQSNASHPFASGETYTVSVDLTAAGGGGQPNVHLVLFDTTAGQSVASLTVPSASILALPTFTPFSFNYAVEPARVGNNWQLQINSDVWGGFTGIDNASVTAVVDPNLITNGGFDTDLSGWDYIPFVNTSAAGVQWFNESEGGPPHNDGMALHWGGSDDGGYLRQDNVSHPFAAGETYTVSFDLSNEGNGEPNVLATLYDTTAAEAVASLTVLAAQFDGTRTTFSFDYPVEASRVGHTWRIDITPIQWGSYTGVDNVSVIATAIPEPSSLALLGTSLIGFGTCTRRKRKQ